MAALYELCDDNDATGSAYCIFEEDSSFDNSVTASSPATDSSKPESSIDAGETGLPLSTTRSLPTFKVFKVEAECAPTLESVLQKYVDSSSASSLSSDGSQQHSAPPQQIIILKLSDNKNSNGKEKSNLSADLQKSGDSRLWVTLGSTSSPCQSGSGTKLVGCSSGSADVKTTESVVTGSLLPDQESFLIEESSLYLPTSDSTVGDFAVTDADISSSLSCSASTMSSGGGAMTSDPAVTTSSSHAHSVFAAKKRQSDIVAPSAGGNGRRSRGAQSFYKCTDCDLHFSAKYRLLAHMKLHAGKSAYVCNQCGDQFPVKNMLSNHLLQHAGQLTCGVCGRVLSTKRSLQRHMAQHTGKKDYKCSHCRKEFFDRVQLVEHVRTHTGEKPFVCELCGTAFARNSNLLAHMRIHREEKPYRCSICSREFRWRNNMLLHQRKHNEQSKSADGTVSVNGRAVTDVDVNSETESLCRANTPTIALLSDSAVSNDSVDVGEYCTSAEHAGCDSMHRSPALFDTLSAVGVDDSVIGADDSCSMDADGLRLQSSLDVAVNSAAADVVDSVMLNFDTAAPFYLMDGR